MIAQWIAFQIDYFWRQWSCVLWRYREPNDSNVIILQLTVITVMTTHNSINTRPVCCSEEYRSVFLPQWHSSWHIHAVQTDSVIVCGYYSQGTCTVKHFRDHFVKSSRQESSHVIQYNILTSLCFLPPCMSRYC